MSGCRVSVGMNQTLFTVRLLPLLALVIPLATADGAGGTATVATPGREAPVAESLPGGVDALINDASRTQGWNSWFSEWPNDVNHYGYEIESTDDLNRLIRALAKVKSEIRQVRLATEKEPSGLGWVTRLKEGNGLAAVFSVGDQSRIDEWYKRVRKPFGVHEFLAAPTAVPPTLTIYVQNEAVDLRKLKIPEGITVSAGGLPGVFHRFNTKGEREREKRAAAAEKSDAAKKSSPSDADSTAAARLIEEFLTLRESP